MTDTPISHELKITLAGNPVVAQDALQDIVRGIGDRWRDRIVPWSLTIYSEDSDTLRLTWHERPARRARSGGGVR